MKIQEALKKISNFLKVKEIAFFVLEKDSINVELEKSEVEAIRILMTKFEQLQKENAELRKLADHYQNLINYKYIQKENIEKKIDEQTERIDKLLDEMIDKSIGGINVSGLNKKEREQVIAKRNGLLVQKATLQQVKEELLKGE